MKNTFIQNSLFSLRYNINWLAEHCFGQSIASKTTGLGLSKKREQNLKELKAKGHIGQALQVDIRENLSQQEFIDQYLKKNKPVVLRGAAKKWACMNWTPDMLNERYGDDDIPLINASPNIDSEEEMDYSVRTVKFKEVIEGMKVGDNNLYSRFNDLFGKHPELQDDVDTDWFINRREKLVSGKVFQCFVGGKGTYTHIHSAIQSNFFVQVYGEKRWLLYPPSYNQYFKPLVEGRPYFSTFYHPGQQDFTKYPEMEYLDYYDILLSPGDILYNPPSWWHHVINETMTIGFGFRWTSLAATMMASPMQLLLTLTAYNPSILFAIKVRGNFAKVFGHKRK